MKAYPSSSIGGAAVEELTQRLLDLNRNIGQPKKITTVFERKVTQAYKGKLQSVIEDLDLTKQYVRDDRLLTTEPATNNVYDYNVKPRPSSHCAQGLLTE